MTLERLRIITRVWQIRAAMIQMRAMHLTRRIRMRRFWNHR